MQCTPEKINLILKPIKNLKMPPSQLHIAIEKNGPWEAHMPTYFLLPQNVTKEGRLR